MRNGCFELLLVIAIVLATVFIVGAQDDYEEEEEYSYEGEDDYYGSGDAEVDHCSQYDADDDDYDDGAGGQCSHALFPEQDEIPVGAMRCCDGHRYRQILSGDLGSLSNQRS